MKNKATKPIKGKEYILWTSYFTCHCGHRIAKVLHILPKHKEHLLLCVKCKSKYYNYNEHLWSYVPKKYINLTKVLYE